MSAVAVEPLLELENGLRLAVSRPEANSLGESLPPTEGDIQPWEVHSELVLVCPEVCRRALELLPERDPDAFLARAQEPVRLPPGTADERELAPGLAPAVFGYAYWRLAQTARSALFAVGGLVAVASLAEVLH